MKKTHLLFLINQFYKGGAESALLNLFCALPSTNYEVDFIVMNQLDISGTLSLIPRIPSWIRVIDVQKELSFSFCGKVINKILHAAGTNDVLPASVAKWLKLRNYDAAISYGEWFSPAIVATKISAKRKYVWIHSDLDKSINFHADILRLHYYFDGFLFASNRSKECATQKYPLFQNRSFVVHNIASIDCSIDISRPEIISFTKPVLLTIANIRREKNHLRQVAVMKCLKNQGVDFQWLNIGSMADTKLVSEIKSAILDAHLEKDFLLLGADNNPFSYMKHADAVCVLSDYESWSMVITESKLLGIPVIATKTSGAIEQIQHQETGLLCDFSVSDIAEQIKYFLSSPTIGQYIRNNLRGFSPSQNTLLQLDPLFHNHTPKLLYIFDDINYISGARNASILHLENIEKQYDITLFSSSICKDAQISSKYAILDLSNNLFFQSIFSPVKTVLWSNKWHNRHKLFRLLYGVLSRFSLEAILCNFMLIQNLKWMNFFDVICVSSEASQFRSIVAHLKSPRKVQWIHTDYAAWYHRTKWTRSLTHHDAKLYKCYDKIICLSPRLAANFTALYPHLKNKTIVIPNPVPYRKILQKAEGSCSIPVDKQKFNIITIGRLDWEKNHIKLIDTALELKNKNLQFHWFFVGDGVLHADITQKRQQLGLEKEITITGTLVNPYPLMKQCDLFVLFSEYEGTPVTIEEAKVLGLPILANDVGGIADQIESYNRGVIIQSFEEIGPQIVLHYKNKRNI